MGAERWIVFLVLVSLGGGICIMSYLVDEEGLQMYGERVAEYNAQHHETMMDAALHRAKRGPVFIPLHVRSNGDVGSELMNNAEIEDHPYSENDRVMRARVDDGGDLDAEANRVMEEPDHPGQEAARARRSSGQGINEEDPDHPYHDEPSHDTSNSGNPNDLPRLSQRLLFDDGDKKLITFNKGIDFILGLMNSMFSLEGEVSVPLPGLNKTFGHGIMQGTFEASRGFFRNPATLHRTGDVAIVKNGDSVALEVALGLETLEAGYDHYHLKILKIHQNGTIDVSIAENSIKMKISLTYYPHCKVDVNYLELDKLGGIKIGISGLGAFQSMFDMLSKWLLENFTDGFRNIVNEKLVDKAKKAVAREDICNYFPLNLLPHKTNK